MSAFGQTSASLGGTVTDASQSVLTGAGITAINVDTGVETRATTNNAGVYNFPSLQPGAYNVSAQASGFQRFTRTGVRLGAGSQIRLNFEMAVAGTVTEVEVTSSVESMVLEAGSSTGVVLADNVILDLPMVSNDTLDLINVMGGAVVSDWGNMGYQDSMSTFAGVFAKDVNVSRDGITVSEVRFNTGVSTASRLNTEMVGEFKMILSPVDAELGRGAGQLQMTTKSGSNAFHGSAVWNIQNSALDAYDFSDKDTGTLTARPWRNLHAYTLTASGPIIKNRTFFFVSWDQQISKTRSTVTTPVLTPCARKGIYRYLTTTHPTSGATVGVRNTNAYSTPTLVQGNNVKSPQLPTVDINTGLPLTSYTIPELGSLEEWAGKTVPLTTQYVSVLDNNFVWNDSYGANCENYTIPASGTAATGWDNYRYGYDRSGFISRFTEIMPPANNWESGDGLNIAATRWTRTSNGVGLIYGGSLYDENRKSISFKIDHSINDAHRISGTYSYEKADGVDGEELWETGYGGVIVRKPQTFTTTLVSTLRPTLLNEFRVGLSRSSSTTYDPLNNPTTGKELADILTMLLPTTDTGKFPRLGGTAEPIVAGPGLSGSGVFFHPDGGIGTGSLIGHRGTLQSMWGGHDPRWTFSDTITWMRGTHSFKGGFEFRRAQSWQEYNGNGATANGMNVYPSVRGGIMSAYSPFRNNAFSGDPDGAAKVAAPNAPGADTDYSMGVGQTGNYAGMYGLMTYMSGSIGAINQYFYVTDAKNPRWSDPLLGENLYVADMRQREFSFFFKDDWKITDNLTLNLGVRYEYYGVPWNDIGLTAGVKDGLRGMFGASGVSSYADFMPAKPVETSYRTEQIFIGPNSQNPDIQAYNKDWNNWAPHVGFAWQLPWFGKGQTTLRGGYSISYTPIANFDHMEHQSGYALVLANAPGMVYSYSYGGHNNCISGESGCYLNFDNFGVSLPLNDSQNGFFGLSQQPEIMSLQPIEKRDQVLTMFDPDIRSPYIQSLTLALTRNVGSFLTVDARYIGTLSRKLVQKTPVNAPNFINNGLIDELIKIRAGSKDPADWPILNTYIAPNTLYPGLSSAADQIRRQYQSALGQGNLMSVANSLATANCAPGSSCTAVGGQAGQVLRIGADRYPGMDLAPNTLIYANPQYANTSGPFASYSSVLLNRRHSNYHSMQAQVTMRPTKGLNFQATYTWSRNLGRDANIGDYNDWGADYWLMTMHRSHQLNFNGNYTLPFGANGFFFRGAHGAVKKAIEGWNLGWIVSVTSGNPMSLAGVNTLWNHGALDLVRPDLWDNKAGKYEYDWEDGDGYYFGKRFTRVPDPICGNSNFVQQGLDLTAGYNLSQQCNNSLRALAVIDHFDADGKPVAGDIVFQNSEPGRRGNFKGANLTGPGRWTLDMNMGKRIDFMEGKSVEIRLDAQNMLNHPMPAPSASLLGARNYTPGNPSVTVNTSSTAQFGLVGTKMGHRTFQAKIRFAF